MKKGIALIVAVFVVITFSIVGVIAVSILSSQGLGVLKDFKGSQALNVAEAGMNYSLVMLKGDSNWSDNISFSKTFAQGQFNISYSSQQPNSVVVTSTGVVGGISRSVQATVSRGGGLPEGFTYALYAGNQGGGPLIIQNSAVVDGDFYYNGNVTMKNSARLINGTMVSNALTLQNSATCASWEPLPTPPVPPPSFESTYYQNVLQETTKSASSALNLSGTSVLNLSGQTRYYTSITISNSARVNGPGTLVSTTGNFVLQNSAIIGDSVRIIVKGSSTFSNSASVGNTVEVISNGSVTIQNGQNFPKNNLLYTNGDLVFNNSAYFYGSILVPYGNMTSVNSTKFRGIIYGYGIDLQNTTELRGSVVVDDVGYFSNSAKVVYDPSVFPTNWPIGLEGGGGSGITVSNWKEIY